MKKTWNQPTIDTLSLLETEHDTLQGADVDGTWTHIDESTTPPTCITMESFYS